MKNNPTPGNPNPATSEGTINNADVGAGENWVKSYLRNDRNTGGQVVVNVTGPGSQFGPGYVAQTVTDGGAHTYGEGTSLIQSAFVFPYTMIVNELVWGLRMDKFIDECTCK